MFLSYWSYRIDELPSVSFFCLHIGLEIYVEHIYTDLKLGAAFLKLLSGFLVLAKI